MRSRWLAVAALLMLAAAPARAEIVTALSLLDQDEDLPRLGLPVVAFRVESWDPERSSRLATMLAGDMEYLAHAKAAAEDGVTDYVLLVTISPPRTEGRIVRLFFTARLDQARGRTAWQAEGQVEVRDAALDDRVLRSIGRNVLSDLIRFGWLPYRDHPEHAPPAAPRVRAAR